jgi:hypothetical protein
MISSDKGYLHDPALADSLQAQFGILQTRSIAGLKERQARRSRIHS